eukprot:CAMPEP_0172360466 /NCGR_PEP_ID=MMETSP1060-20121228/4468_1 /TAXON_ID=37318 /ORGANISM="Pseudo-nitzschia pungens, Strain cf. cingulata" /LENGTH=121 /DNA_ID=CAMNT_0013082455 /DNA_START=246 /DNA_END=611 /DNA_ORIENTATION=-
MAVGFLQGCLFADAFRSMSLKRLNEPSSSISSRRTKGSSRTPTVFASGNDETKKDDEIDDEFDDDEELPMFVLDYNSDNIDYSQLPVPPFTSGLVLLVSTAFTVYLYYVGLTGGIATDPNL